MATENAAQGTRRWNVFALFCCAVGAALVVSIFHEGRVRFAWDLKSSDVMAIIIGGAGLILTAVGIFVAILAFWGWSTIRRDSITSARKEAKRCVAAYLESEEAEAAIDKAVVAFLQRNIEQGTLLPYISERIRKSAAMSELDVGEVDDAWGTERYGDDTAAR